MKKQGQITSNTLQDQFTMARATEAQTDEVLSLLIETAKWFKSKGSTQWNGLLEGIDTHNTKEAILRGDVFVCQAGREVAGMVMLLKTPSEWDLQLWGKDDIDLNNSVYLHRLAIHRKYAGYQLGKSIVQWCQQDIQFPMKTKLRLDCLGNNSFLNSFYKKKGFTYRGEVDGYSLYESNLNK